MQIRSHTKRKQNLGLTVTAATTQARRIVDKVMPGAGATVESRLSADPTTLESTVITTVTFPRDSAGQLELVRALDGLSGVQGYDWADSSIVITRKV